MTGKLSDTVAEERDFRASIANARLKNARNQVAFREVNERITELTSEWRQTEMSLFICECSDPECAESLEITPAEYERVRMNGARFIVLGGHELPEVERVVEGNGRFLVVEKIGPAATIARDADPRHG
jgi:hypothetical protein